MSRWIYINNEAFIKVEGEKDEYIIRIREEICPGIVDAYDEEEITELATNKLNNLFPHLANRSKKVTFVYRDWQPLN